MNFKAIIMNKIKSPSFLIKLCLISALFICAINIELGTVINYSKRLIGENKINGLVFIDHIFSYFEMYAEYFLIGMIIFIPDILNEPYLTDITYIKNDNRFRLCMNTIKLIAIYTLLFMLWFILLTIIFSFFRINLFSFSWPQDLMDSVFQSTGGQQALISIPYSATKYPLILSSLLIFVKVFIGFFLVSLAAFYISFKKQNVSYGIGLAVILYVASDLLFWNNSTVLDIFNDQARILKLDTFAYKYSLCTFFTFESLKVDFMGRILHAYILGIVLSVILILLIKRETKIKDLC